MKHRFAALLLTGAMILSLVACGNSQQQQNVEPAASEAVSATSEEPTTAPSDTEVEKASEPISEAVSEPETSEEPSTEPSNAETESTGGKTLVVYYSATGSTETVAKVIADATGADLFELEPVEPYSSDDLDWTNDDSRVNREHENESEQVVELVASTVDNWTDYDVVFIGYPIWWGNAAWPVNGFIETNDFTGKTVIPFCTSSSSELGESGELLEEMAGTGDWQEGQRFRSSVSEDDVRAWVEGLGF